MTQSEKNIHTRPRILLISLDDSLLENMKNIFRDEALDWYCRGTTEIALASLERERYELVLVDGEPEGKTHILSQVQALVEHESHPSVICMIDATQLHIAVEALQLGAVNFISVPFDDNRLRQIILKDIHLLLNIRKMREITPVVSGRKLLLRIPSKLNFLGGAIFEVLENAKKNDFPIEEYQHEIKLSLSEAIVNAIVHGNEKNQGKNVHIESNITRDRFHIVIRDEGAGFNAESVPDPTKPENIIKVGGRGIFLMRCYMDEVSFNQKGNELQICLNAVRVEKKETKE